MNNIPEFQSKELQPTAPITFENCVGKEPLEMLKLSTLNCGDEITIIFPDSRQKFTVAHPIMCPPSLRLLHEIGPHMVIEDGTQMYIPMSLVPSNAKEANKPKPEIFLITKEVITVGTRLVLVPITKDQTIDEMDIKSTVSPEPIDDIVCKRTTQPAVETLPPTDFSQVKAAFDKCIKYGRLTGRDEFGDHFWKDPIANTQFLVQTSGGNDTVAMTYKLPDKDLWETLVIREEKNNTAHAGTAYFISQVITPIIGEELNVSVTNYSLLRLHDPELPIIGHVISNNPIADGGSSITYIEDDLIVCDATYPDGLRVKFRYPTDPVIHKHQDKEVVGAFTTPDGLPPKLPDLKQITRKDFVNKFLYRTSAIATQLHTRQN